MAPTKILVAVNASETSLRAVRYAVDIIMGREEFSVHILTVEQFPEADLFAEPRNGQRHVPKPEPGCASSAHRPRIF